MNKQELIEKIKNLSYTLTWNIPRINREIVIDLIEQLNEPQKPVVPQFVADWIEYFKNCKATFYGSTNPLSYYGRVILEDFEGDYEEVLRWIRDNSETYARAWLDGYTVEKEKKYRVSLKNGQPLLKAYLGNALYFSQDIAIERCKVTRKQLEEAGFGWVFDCPGIEIEEVE